MAYVDYPDRGVTVAGDVFAEDSLSHWINDFKRDPLLAKTWCREWMELARAMLEWEIDDDDDCRRFARLSAILSAWAVRLKVNAMPILEYEQAATAWQTSRPMASGRYVDGCQMMALYDRAACTIRLFTIAANAAQERKTIND